MFSLLALLAASGAADVSAIKALRARSNSAIAAHDHQALKPLQTNDYSLLPGSLGKPLRAEEVDRRLSVAFSDPSFVTYVRKPARIAVSRSRKRAAETGTWLGTWRKPDGLMRVEGVYQAMWVPQPQGWRLQNESFVTLSCTGSRSCADFD